MTLVSSDSGRTPGVVLSGIDPRFDQQIVQRMREAAEPGDAIWLTAPLSRISRHLGKLLQAVEYLLAHDVSVIVAFDRSAATQAKWHLV